MKISFTPNLFVITALILFSMSPCKAAEPLLNIDEILTSSGNKFNQKKLLASEIITVSRPDKEQLKSQLALVMLLYVQAPLKQVVAALHENSNLLSSYPNALAMPITLSGTSHSLQNAGFTPNEKQEVDRLFNYENGNDFNLSPDEQVKLQEIVHQSTGNNDGDHERAILANQFFQQLLQQRFKTYLTSSDTPAYHRKDKKVSINKEFETANNNMEVMQKWFPDFYASFNSFPHEIANQYDHNFYLIKDGIEGRPVFILKHQMTEIREDRAIIAERQFYISHSLDAVQVAILCMPYKDGTIIGLGSQSFTYKVAGMGTFIAHKIGRSQMSKQIRPIFEIIQQKFSQK